ncbi:MAG TPA: hypothetical protein VIV63_01110 [Steroidobacteraceae bacterium]
MQKTGDKMTPVTLALVIDDSKLERKTWAGYGKTESLCPCFGVATLEQLFAAAVAGQRKCRRFTNEWRD